MQKPGTIFAPLPLLFLMCACVRAQQPPQLVVFVDSLPVIVAAPAPFVEVSRNLPDVFAQRSRAVSASGRLLAWFIPAQALKDQLDGKPARCRTLQVQVIKEMEPVRYNAQTFRTLRDETLSACAAPQITEADAETLFGILDLKQLTRKPGGQKILGAAELGPDSFTLCVAVSTEGSDRMGGRTIETSVTCVTYMLIKEKILLLTVTGPELTANELRNTMRLTREWLTLLRWPQARGQKSEARGQRTEDRRQFLQPPISPPTSLLTPDSFHPDSFFPP